LFTGWTVDSRIVYILHGIQCTSRTLVHINGVLHWLHWLFYSGHQRFSAAS